MNYVLEKISTVQACDALLAGAKKKKQNLERRMRNLGETLGTFRKRLDQVQQESAQVQSSLEIFTGAFGALPEGKDKVNMKIRIKRLELQQAMLEKKETIYNVGALLVKEMQYNRLHSQVVAQQDYILAVEQRRMVLEAPALRVVQPAVLLRQPVVRPAHVPQVLRLPEIRSRQENYLSSFLHKVRTGLSYHLLFQTTIFDNEYISPGMKIYPSTGAAFVCRNY
jgi:hypothetical protein